MNCTFCRIIAGDLEASRVLETERIVAFMDVAPLAEGHVLVVPREHRDSLLDVDEADAAATWEAARRIGRAAVRTLNGCQGINVFASVGAVAGQEVPHAHVHVVPRRPGDGFEYRVPSTPAHPPRETLDRLAAKLAGGLESG